jgi:hypothetical protein
MKALTTILKCTAEMKVSSASRQVGPPYTSGMTRNRLFPDVGLLIKSGAACVDNAEAMLARRLHHGPAFHFLDHRGAESLQAFDLGIDVIGLDIDVYTTRVFNALQNHTRISWITLHVEITSAGARTAHFTTEYRAPELRFTIKIFSFAINNYGTQSTFVHFSPLFVLLVGKLSMLSDAVPDGQDCC